MRTGGQRLLGSLGLLILAAQAVSAGQGSFFGPPPYGDAYREWKASRGKGPGAYQPVAQTAAAPAQDMATPMNVPPIVLLEVQVPPGAELWVDDLKSQQTGGKRIFRSPELERGKTYKYTIRARWMNDKNLPIEQTQQISVQAGSRAVIDFTQP